jgi:hypothetical protein
LVFIAYLGGFASGVKKYFPYRFVKNISEKYSEKVTNFEKMKSCRIQKLITLPDSFSLIIGHAYGAPENIQIDDFIAKNIYKFLTKNINKIDKIVLTGDVFAYPSIGKWQRLFQEFQPIDIFVAPGNHDVERPDSRDVFYAIDSIKHNYPYEIEISGLNVILDDSVLSKWVVDEKVTRQIENTKRKDIIVTRHHVFITELLQFANSPQSPEALPTVGQFIKNYPNDKSITWIMGDGGAFEKLPRITCHLYGNHRFIVNGIGEKRGDVILIISNGTIYQYVLT